MMATLEAGEPMIITFCGQPHKLARDNPSTWRGEHLTIPPAGLFGAGAAGIILDQVFVLMTCHDVRHS